jgi:hypothetical protein
MTAPDLRALTVQQPWAFAIAAGEKTIENRTRGMNYRGLLAIHAGKRFSDRGRLDARVQALLAEERVGESDLTFGAIIAVGQLVDSHPDGDCCRPWGESAYDEHGGQRRTLIHHLVLEDVFALPEPVPANGALGLWRPVPEDTADILRQLPTALCPGGPQ